MPLRLHRKPQDRRKTVHMLWPRDPPASMHRLGLRGGAGNDTQHVDIITGLQGVSGYSTHHLHLRAPLLKGMHLSLRLSTGQGQCQLLLLQLCSLSPRLRQLCLQPLHLLLRKPLWLLLLLAEGLRSRLQLLLLRSKLPLQ